MLERGTCRSRRLHARVRVAPDQACADVCVVGDRMRSSGKSLDATLHRGARACESRDLRKSFANAAALGLQPSDPGGQGSLTGGALTAASHVMLLEHQGIT